MFERYSICSSTELICERYAVDLPAFFKPIYNAAPSMLLPVIIMDQPEGLSRFYWGQPPEWTKNKSISEKLINVRLEQLEQKPVFQKKLNRKRCLVLADGLYAWRRTGKKSAIPYRLVLPNNDLFSMAGLWEDFEDESGKAMHTFSVITKPSQGKLLNYCDRLPFILSSESEKYWMNSATHTDELLKLINEEPQKEFEMYSVSTRINSKDVNDDKLILPTPPADQFGNLSLFD